MFDGISDYIITKPQLCGRSVISLVAYDYLIMGFPMCIEGRKYHRNALLWNLGLIIDKDTRSDIYEPILRKLGYLLKNLEVESEFLFRGETKRTLETIIEQIHAGLNRKGECSIPIDESHSINLRLITTLPAPCEVKDYEVPVAVADIDTIAYKYPQLDLTIRKISGFIDGVSCVKKIAKEAHVALDLTKKALQHLLYYGLVVMVDAFQYSNLYTVTAEVSKLADDATVQSECLRCISLPGATGSAISFEEVFSMYGALNAATSFRDFCTERDCFTHSVDDRSFIVFGVLNGLVRRVHQFPIATLPLDGSALGDVAKEKKLQAMLDGTHCDDEICCSFELSWSKLESLLQSDPAHVIIYRDRGPDASHIIARLPADVLREILSYVDPVSLLSVGQVCKKFNQYSSDDRLWLRLCPYVYEKKEIRKQFVGYLRVESREWIRTSTWREVEPTRTNIKMAVLGPLGAGKTALILRMAKNEWKDYTEPTIGAAFLAMGVTLPNRRAKLEIWDVGGKTMYHSLYPMYTRGAPLLVLCYDASDPSSVHKIPSHILFPAGTETRVVLVGCKADLLSAPAVVSPEVEDWIDKNPRAFVAKHFFASAKTAIGTSDLALQLFTTVEGFATHLPSYELARKYLLTRGIKLRRAEVANTNHAPPPA